MRTLLITILVLIPTLADAGQFHTQWSPNPEPDIAGYYVVDADTGAFLTGLIPATTTTLASPPALPGRNIAVVAQDTAGNQSDIGASYTIPTPPTAPGVPSGKWEFVIKATVTVGP